MELKCYNQKCLHRWFYRGKATEDKQTITCPKCLYKLRLGKAKLGYLPNLPNEKLGYLPNEKTTYRKELIKPQTEFIEEDNFERVDIGEGITVLVKNKIAKQFMEAPEEEDEEEPSITTHDFPLPKKIQEKLDEEKRKELDPLETAPKINSGTEIKDIGYC